MYDQLPEEINEDFLNDDYTDLHEEMMERTNQHTDPVQTPQVQPPSSCNHSTSHDNHIQQVHCHIFLIRWETNSTIRMHLLHINLLY